MGGAVLVDGRRIIQSSHHPSQKPHTWFHSSYTEVGGAYQLENEALGTCPWVANFLLDKWAFGNKWFNIKLRRDLLQAAD